MAESGVRGLYVGLTASLLRQMTYSTVRLGVYDEIKKRVAKSDSPHPGQLLLAAGLAGGLGGIAGNPAGMCHLQRGCREVAHVKFCRHPVSANDYRPASPSAGAISISKCYHGSDTSHQNRRDRGIIQRIRNQYCERPLL